MPQPELVSFLDFKFDPSSGELLRGNKRLRIPKQTSQLLAIFLSSPGTVITRAELQEQLWPGGEFLDHEHAINRVITDLRAVFRDNARSPRYIETVHKRGYRFLPAITVDPRSSPPIQTVPVSEPAPATAPTLETPPVAPSQPVARIETPSASTGLPRAGESSKGIRAALSGQPVCWP